MNSLWNLFQELAKGMDGADVVIALKRKETTAQQAVSGGALRDI